MHTHSAPIAPNHAVQRSGSAVTVPAADSTFHALAGAPRARGPLCSLPLDYARRPLKSVISICAFLAITACNRVPDGWVDSSASVRQSRSRDLFLAEYTIPDGAVLGDYRPIEIWAESDPQSPERRIVVRLNGPHHGGSIRVGIRGFDATQYRGIWSERNGPPYEMWAAPDPLPDTLKLERNGKQIEVKRRNQ